MVMRRPTTCGVDQPRVLFISYDGLLDPIGQSQVLPYLRGLAARGAAMTVLSFEKAGGARTSGRILALQQELTDCGVRWVPLRYHKRPTALATAYDVMVGLVRAWRIVRRDQIQIVHARSYVAAIIAWLLKRWLRVRFVFSTIGFWIEERSDIGFWSSRRLLYRLAKRLEQWFFQDADEIVTLTQRARQIIERWPGLKDPRVSVVPTCVDLTRFSPPEMRREAPDGAPVIIYIGSAGTCYLMDQICHFVERARRRFPGVRLIVLSPNQDEVAAAVQRTGLPLQTAIVRSVDHEQIPSYLAQAHVGLAFYKPAFARVGTCPTKIGEYLAMGLPVVINQGVGDTQEVLETHRVGVVLQEFSTQAYDSALDELERLWRDPELSKRCRQVAEQSFALQEGVDRYWRIYHRKSKRVLFLVPYPRDCAPSQRLKFEQYYAHFEQQGIEVTTSSFVSQALWRILYEPGHWVAKGFWTAIGYLRRAWDVLRAGRFDAVYLHLWAVPFGPPWFEEWLARRNIPIIYDIDDLIYLPKASRANAFLARLRKKEATIARIMRVATHVIVCTQHLERFARQHNPAITCISSTIDTTLYVPRRHSQAQSSVTIGWSGSHSTATYLRLLEPMLRALSRQFDIRLLVIGDARVRLGGVQVEARPWSLARETADLAEMDIGVYPLPDEEWALGKSGLKALQYMGMGIPVVASAIGEACRFIRDGENGWLARTPQEWMDRLSQLIRDPERRRAMGMAGRMTVEQSFSVRVTASKYQRVLNAVLDPAAEDLQPVGPPMVSAPSEAYESHV